MCRNDVDDTSTSSLARLVGVSSGKFSFGIGDDTTIGVQGVATFSIILATMGRTFN